MSPCTGSHRAQQSEPWRRRLLSYYLFLDQWERHDFSLVFQEQMLLMPDRDRAPLPPAMT